MTQRICNVILIAESVLCLLVGVDCRVYAQVPTSAASPSPSACTPIPPPPCKDGASPGVIQLALDTTSLNKKLKLAGKHLFLSSCPFDLASNVVVRTAPSLRSYYNSVGASSQMIKWLEENNCDTVYCRELTTDEVKCEGIDPVKCVPEFVKAYSNALEGLNGNQELARKWVTNYPPLSLSSLRIGFYDAKTEWLKRAVEAIERGHEGTYKIRSTITDKNGVAFVYDLCPGSYYVSSIAPIEVDGAAYYWETTKPIDVKGPPEVNTAVVVTLLFPPPPVKVKKNFFVGKPVVTVVSGQNTTVP